MTFQSSSQVYWVQVWSLASVQGAISLAWIAYSIYFPKFIEQVFNYSSDRAVQFAALIFLIEGAIALIIEPVFGALSDRWRHWYGSQMPIIASGAIASTVIFMALPCVVIFGGSTQLAQSLLPSLAILWALVMATFRSPVLSLLGGFAYTPQLPQAASILTMIGALVSSIRPLATNFIIGLGAPLTFAISSISLLLGMGGLRIAMTYFPKESKPEVELEPPQPIQPYLVNLLIVLVVGIAIGLGMRLLLGQVLPQTLKTVISPELGIRGEVLVGAGFFIQAFFALGAGFIAKNIANKYLITISLGGIAACLVSLLLINDLSYKAIATSIVILFLFACISSVNNGTIPFALTMVPKSLAGVGVGTYLGGVSIAIASLGFLIPKLTEFFTLPNIILMTLIAFLSAGIGIIVGSRNELQY